MFRTIALPVVLGAALLGSPALADSNGSTEQRTEKRSCSAKADPHYSKPTGKDCKGKNKTYQATYYSNDVKCGDKNAVTPANPTGIRVYGSGDPAAQNGQVSMCSDGGGSAPAPAPQGRASFGGSPATGPTVVVDGDKDNSNTTAQGYIIVNAKPGSAPTYRCGDEYDQGGRADSDAPEDRDNAGECGS